MPPKILKLQNKQDELHCKLWEKPGAEFIILLHGGPGGPDYLDSVAQFLNKYFQVIGFDQRGTGKSPCHSNDYSIEAYISDIYVIKEQFGMQKFHLLGRSWGGLLALLFAQKTPGFLNSLFLCSPASGTGKLWAKTMVEVGRFNRKNSSLIDLIKIAFYSFVGGIGIDRGVQNFHYQLWMNYSKPLEVQAPPPPGWVDGVYAKAVNQTAKNILKYRWQDEPSNFLFPVQVTYGSHDIYGDSKNELLSSSNKKVVIIEGTGHLPWLHDRQKFWKVLDEFYGKF